VAFVPGDAFFASDIPASVARRYLRLNFSNAGPEKIHDGIRRLAAAVERQIASTPRRTPLNTRPQPVDV
jgi:DNA-binding transcriptional MocR family regulator